MIESIFPHKQVEYQVLTKKCDVCGGVYDRHAHFSKSIKQWTTNTVQITHINLYRLPMFLL